MLRDLMILLKPSILLLSVLMAALGIWLAPNTVDWVDASLMLVGTGLIVGSANALNMYLERDVDGRMERTKNRPLPTGRMRPAVALVFGSTIGLVGTVMLYLWGNPLTAGLGYFALVSYVLVYTPLKRKTPQALAIGAIPGAMPPLMGWTMATGSIDAPGLALFGILMLWQLPHFIAITIYRKHDYAAAGFRAVAVVRGEENAKWQTLAYGTLLVPLSVLLTPLGATGWIYLVGSLGVSLWFLSTIIRGFRTMRPAPWARRVFLASLVYLPALGAVLIVDRLVG
ncbi:MAG: protoheme IX farnesyltransferase [Myxococcota bacterium]|jgi:protoheme IX farnesyltransferase